MRPFRNARGGDFKSAGRRRVARESRERAIRKSFFGSGSSGEEGGEIGKEETFRGETKRGFRSCVRVRAFDIERAKEAAMSACAEATKSLERARIAFLAASRGPSGDDSSSSEDESGDECSSAAAAAAVSAALAAAAAVSVPADAPSGATPTRATATALAAARKAPEESAEDGASNGSGRIQRRRRAAAEMRATRAKTSSLPRAPLRELGENVEEAA
jgi:hypothetical protein